MRSSTHSEIKLNSLVGSAVEPTMCPAVSPDEDDLCQLPRQLAALVTSACLLMYLIPPASHADSLFPLPTEFSELADLKMPQYSQVGNDINSS